MTAPVVQAADSSQPFIVTTDAFDCAMGAVLEQRHDGKKVVIAYGLHKFTEVERQRQHTRRKCLPCSMLLKCGGFTLSVQ